MAANTSLHENPPHERASVRLGVAVGALLLCSQCLSNLDGFDSGPGANNQGSGSGGGSSGAAGDASAAGDAGAGGDAGGQGGAGSGGAGGTGGVAVNPAQAPAVYAATSAWCAQAKADPEIDFCADFDSEAAALGAFDAPPDKPLFATILPTSSDASSPSNALLVYAQPNTPGDKGEFHARLSKKFDDAASGFTLSFDFRPELMNEGAAPAVVAAVEFLGLEHTYALQITCAQGQMRVEEAYPESAVPLFSHPLFSVPLNEWTRVELVADLDGKGIDVGEGGAAGAAGTGGAAGAAGAGGAGGTGAPTMIVRKGPAGGPLTQVGIARALRFLNGSAFNRKPRLSIGVPRGEFEHRGWALRFDNVVFDLRR